MKDIKDKKIDQFIAEELMKEIGIDEQRMFSRIEFAKEKKTPLYQKPKFYIPALACMLLILMTIVSLLSITIYKNTNESQYKGDDIVYQALETFDNEVNEFDEWKRINLTQVNHNLVWGIYYSQEEQEYYLISYQKIKNDSKYQISFNHELYLLNDQINIFDVAIENTNEIIIYDKNEVIYTLTFQIN